GLPLDPALRGEDAEHDVQVSEARAEAAREAEQRGAVGALFLEKCPDAVLPEAVQQVHAADAVGVLGQLAEEAILRALLGRDDVAGARLDVTPRGRAEYEAHELVYGAPPTPSQRCCAAGSCNNLLLAPENAILPRSSTIAVSAKDSASSIFCSTSTMVSSPRSSPRRANRVSTMIGARPSRGSSSSSTRG